MRFVQTLLLSLLPFLQHTRARPIISDRNHSLVPIEKGATVYKVFLAKEVDATLAFIFLTRDSKNVTNHKVIYEQSYDDEGVLRTSLQYQDSPSAIDKHHFEVVQELHEDLDVLEGLDTWLPRIHQHDMHDVVSTAKIVTDTHSRKRWDGTKVWDLDWSLSVGDYLGSGNWKTWDPRFLIDTSTPLPLSPYHRVTQAVNKVSNMPAILAKKTTIRNGVPRLGNAYASLQVRSSYDDLSRLLSINRNDDLTVGRQAGNSLRLSDTLVSNVHFRIHTVVFNDELDPLCYLTDLSTNGTFFRSAAFKRADFQKIGRYNSVLLCDGDEIEIQRVATFYFQQKHFSPAPIRRLRTDFQSCSWRLSDRKLGSGTFGHVVMAFDKRGRPRQAACKVIDRRLLKANHADAIWKREIDILKRVSHPNVIRTMEIVITEDFVYILAELIASGDLFSRIHMSRDRVYGPNRVDDAERRIAWIIFQVLRALEYLHARGLVHRDVKLENILVASNHPYSRIILTDFGVSRDMHNIPSNKRVRMTSCVGTCSYQAPEMVAAYLRSTKEQKMEYSDKSAGYGNEIDLWSTGCILHVMLVESSPLRNNMESIAKLDFKSDRFDLSYTEATQVSLEAQDLLHKLLVVDPSERLTIAEGFHHAWLSQYSTFFAQLVRHSTWQVEIYPPVVARLDTIPDITCDEAGAGSMPPNEPVLCVDGISRS